MPETPSFKLREPPPPPERVTPCDVAYAELDVTTNFSFLRGASHPDEMVYTAAALGYRAIAITDVCTLAGAVRAHAAARQCGMKLIVGARLTFADGTPDLLVWCPDRAAYGRLCRLLTIGKRRTEKAKCELYLQDFLEHSEGLLAAISPFPLRGAGRDEASASLIHDAIERLWDFDISPLTLALSPKGESGRLWLAAHLSYGPDDQSQLQRLIELSRRWRVPLVATNHVHYHAPARRALQDVLVCVREGVTIDQAGYRLFPNAERYLKSPEQMHRLFAACPSAVAATVQIANRCAFNMSELQYEYPSELVPPEKTAIEYLKELTWQGAAERFASRGSSIPSLPDHTRELINNELALIEQLKFEHYFLTVHDLVRFARSRGILCQGRGSAANSAVCYCLGVTSVDPSKIDLLFERFISAERGEPPDIDIDFEHERREEVIQYLYQKYGRDRAGLAAEVITYRGRSAIRDVGKALGLSLDMVDSMARKLDWWHRGVLNDQQIRETGLDPNDPNVRRVIAVSTELLGFPRHLGQHVGGMVMSRGPLCEVVPIENARMEDRTVVEWDKDDLEELGLLKVDVLGLGMLTCISKAFRLVERFDQETKRRRDEETKWEGVIEHGDGAHVSGSDCLATWDGTRSRRLLGYAGDAEGRAVRVDEPAPTVRGLDPVEHRGGVWQAEQGRPAQVLAHSTRVAERAGDAIRIGNILGVVNVQSFPAIPDRGNRSRPASLDPQPGTQAITLAHSVSSSLRLFVSDESAAIRLQLHTLPPEDPAVYDMICDADTIGVFQIESRAQMTMLPRLRPRNFYDLVIEVAIVRPGPIQGNMVHPYLRRRNGEEEVSYPSEALRKVLHKTLGVPLFQEQAMRVAMVGAGFSGAEADQLRRAMAAWKRSTRLLHFHDRIIQGMLKNGYTREFAERCFEQIKGFGEYGFPESHSASFALLVYASAWLKRHQPAAFAAALINSQPMGFYQPAQIVRDAREHGVEVRPADVNQSDWDCSLESSGQRAAGGGQQRCSLSPAGKSEWGAGGPAMRLGLRMIKGLRQVDAERIVAARGRAGRFGSIDQFKQMTGLSRKVLCRLAEADAFASLGLSRREALWDAIKLGDEQMPLYSSLSPPGRESLLPTMPLGQQVNTDYATVGLSLRTHPLALVRDVLRSQRIITAAELNQLPHGRWVKVAGLVLVRQRPGTASGIVFVTLEDETGVVNLIIRPQTYDRYRPAARHAGLLQCDGYVERQGQVIHVMAKRLFDRSELISGIEFASRDFH